MGLTFSEFGRQVAENGTYGTDHGSSAPMMVFGKGIVHTILIHIVNGAPLRRLLRLSHGPVECFVVICRLLQPEERVVIDLGLFDGIVEKLLGFVGFSSFGPAGALEHRFGKQFIVAAVGIGHGQDSCEKRLEWNQSFPISIAHIWRAKKKSIMTSISFFHCNN